MKTEHGVARREQSSVCTKQKTEINGIRSRLRLVGMPNPSSMPGEAGAYPFATGLGLSARMERSPRSEPPSSTCTVCV